MKPERTKKSNRVTGTSRDEKNSTNRSRDFTRRTHVFPGSTRKSSGDSSMKNQNLFSFAFGKRRQRQRHRDEIFRILNGIFPALPFFFLSLYLLLGGV